LWLNLVFFCKFSRKKVILVGRPEAMTKKIVSFLGRKHRVTLSVAAPGDTNPSDATDFIHRAETVTVSITF